MKIKNFVIGAICSFAFAGSVSAASGAMFSYKPSSVSASSIPVESTIRVYLDVSWSNVTEAHLTDENKSMSTTNDHQQFDETYGTYAMDIESTETLSEIKLYFVQSGKYWHPEEEGNRSFNTTSKLQGEFVPGHAYQVTNLSWTYEYDDGTNKWFTYTINDLGELDTVKYTMLFEITDSEQDNWVIDTTKIYFQTNSDWSANSPRYAAYCYGNGTEATWYDFSSIQGEPKLFQMPRPAEEYTHIIICRMNPATVENNWNNKWNQTADLDFSNEINFYKLNSGWSPSADTSDKWQINKPVPSEYALYSWQGSDKQLGDWPGVALTKVSEYAEFPHAEGTTLYAYEGTLAPQANIIVSITNSKLSEKPQTATTVINPVDGKFVQGYKVDIDVTGKAKNEMVEYAAGVEAYQFMKKFGELTQKRELAEGNICQADPTLRDELISSYATLSQEAKELVDAAMDKGATDTTVGQTMAWLIKRYGGAYGNNPSARLNRNKVSSIIAFIAIGVTALASITYLVIRRKKLAK